MKIEKINDIKAPGDGILSVSFQPHPINDQWDLERVAICGEKGVFIWLFDYNGNHKKLAFIESVTNSIIKLCRWSPDGKYLAIVDMEQISIYYKNDQFDLDKSNYNISNNNGDNKKFSDIYNTDSNNLIDHEIFENWSIYTSFSCNDVNECSDICWLKGSKILVNGTISGNIIFYNLLEKCQSSNLFIKDIVEIGLKKKNLPIINYEIGHVCGINSDLHSLFLACQMSSKRLFIFEITYNKESGKDILSKRNCVNLTYLLEESRLIMNSPCILTFIRKPIFDPLTCLIGCPYGELGTSYFSCLFPFRDISDIEPFNWTEINKSIIRNINKNLMENNLIKNDNSDIWDLHKKGNNTIKSKLEFPEAYRLRGHQRRIRIFQFSSTIFQEKDEIFSFCAQSSQDGSLSLWKIIYDLNSSSKIKSIECFLVLTNFMDEQASVTDISFNNMNNTILIGSDDNKLTLITFEFEEFSLTRISSKKSSLNYLDFNTWYFDYKPKKPSINLKHLQDQISSNQKKQILPKITASEIIEFQEKTQESIINSKGAKIRRIQPLNLTEIVNDHNENDNNTSSNNHMIDNNNHHLNSNMKNNENLINNNYHHNSINTPKNNKNINNNINNYQEFSKNNKIDQDVNETNIDIKLIDHIDNEKKKIIENNIYENYEINNSISNNNKVSNNEFYSNLFIKEFIKNIEFPPRLVIETQLEIDNNIYKITVFADNRKILENKNKDRIISNEIICIKQDLDNDINVNNDKKDILWYKPIGNNNVITKMLRIRDIILIFYSNLNDKEDLFINTKIDILNFKTGTNVITGITIPYVLKLTICEFLNMILLITINKKIKLFQIPTNINDNISSFNINWLLDIDWSYLNNSELEKVDIFPSNQLLNKKNELFDINNRNYYNYQHEHLKPIIILYFQDGKVFNYSFEISNFIRIDDLEYYQSDFWSMILPETTKYYSNKNDKYEILKDISIAISNESKKYDEYIDDIINHTKYISNNYVNDYLLREIQRNSRIISLKSQYSQFNHEKKYKIYTLFDHIINNTIFKSNSNISDSSEKSNDFIVTNNIRELNHTNTKLHIEHQLFSSLTIYSKNEFKYWFKLYIKHALETFNKDLLKEISSNCIRLIRESILNTQINKRKSIIPFWYNYTMLNIIDIDPINLLINDIIPSIDNFIHVINDSSELFQSNEFKLKYNIDIHKFNQELILLKEYITNQINTIKEEYENDKNNTDNLNNNSQDTHLLQNNGINSSKFNILDSFL